MKKVVKTNVMRILDQANIVYQPVYYDLKEQEFSGKAVANLLGLPEVECLKTLTVCSDKKTIFICVIPVNGELDLKKTAIACKVKKVEMVPVKELPHITGYLRGEVSPLGMKKKFPVFFDTSVATLEKVAVSAGKKGVSVLINPQVVAQFLEGHFADLLK